MTIAPYSILLNTLMSCSELCSTWRMPSLCIACIATNQKRAVRDNIFEIRNQLNIYIP